MGRPYADELNALASTVAAATEVDVGPLAAWLTARAAGRPLVACGSGGSVAACALAGLLHEQRYRQPGAWLTPLEFLRSSWIGARATLLVSAGGRNKDILAAADYAIARDGFPFALTARAGTPLEARVEAGDGRDDRKPS